MELEGESSRADSAGSVAKRHRLATARSSNDDADKNFEHQDRSQIQEKENQYSERVSTPTWLPQLTTRPLSH